MATVKKEGKGEVKETMEKRTPEQLHIIDRFDAEVMIAEALLDGCYGIVTSEMCGESHPAVETLIYEIEGHMKEIKKIFKEVTGQ
ncbi:MAG: hypothetical protein WC581_10585, partial [Thermodesulfovibrionales bacterium]